MTPEEIIKLIISEMGTEDVEFYYKNVEQKAIEAINQYAKDMCDRQRRLCYLSGMIDVLEIKTAPYPKELL
jgi:hypothetical protein